MGICLPNGASESDCLSFLKAWSALAWLRLSDHVDRLAAMLLTLIRTLSLALVVDALGMSDARAGRFTKLGIV
jgi:hypothetical protein